MGTSRDILHDEIFELKRLINRIKINGFEQVVEEAETQLMNEDIIDEEIVD